MVLTDFEASILDVLQSKLTIEAQFVGWDYNDPANELEIRVMFGDTTISSTRCNVNPVARTSDDW